MKRQIFKHLAVAALAVSTTLTSCKEDDKVEPELTLGSETVEFATNPSGVESATIQSNTNWSVAIEQIDDWLSVTPMSGNGSATLNITAQVNDDFAERYATITVTVAGAETKTIAVTQAGDETKDVILLEEMVVRYSSQYEWVSRYVFEYDAQHHITKRYRYDNEALIDILTFNFSENLVTISHNLYDGVYPSYGKKGNVICYSQAASSYCIEVNAKEIPVKQTIHRWGQMQKFSSTTTYTYTWVNGNLTIADYEENGVSSQRGEYEESGTETYTYDKKKSPFYHCATPKWFIWWWFGDCNVNNVTSNGDTTYEYTYNEDGFRATEKQGDNTITYTYMKRAGKGSSD